MSLVKHTRVTSTNDSDATVLTAPEGYIYEILHGHVSYTSTATVGNRQIILGVYDADDVLVSDIHAGAVQAASNTYHYLFSRGVYRETSVVDTSLHAPIPFGLVLLPGWYLRVRDSAAIDAAADDMVINVVYRQVNDMQGGTIS